MKPSVTQARSPTLPDRLRECAGLGGVLSFRDFMDIALYAPEVGYYARPGITRVGRTAQADFYTSSSLAGGVFGQLVRAAAQQLLAPALAGNFTLLEIGPEPGTGVFGREAAPFAEIKNLRLGESLTMPSQAAIFANEWLDAQPFHRLVFRRGAWRELGVRVEDGTLTEVELSEISPPARALLPDLPAESAEDYHLDLTLDAETRLRELAGQPWAGCIILADYGLDWNALTHERPAGTARAYYRHELATDLLARPGEQDLTCHVCWDRLERILREQGFQSVRVERQEAFLVRHAAGEIERLLTRAVGQFSRERQTLHELLHPAHLGQKFQILSACRNLHRLTGVSP